MTVDRLVIVADAHLGAAPAADEEALLAFLDEVPQRGDALLLVGDLYDYWFSYDRLIPRRNFRTTAALTHLARRVPVAMVGGNHDRWGGTFWEQDAGIRFAPQRLELAFGDRTAVAIHGDGLHEERPGAAWMHRLTSSRAVIRAYRFLHPDFGFWIADKLGHNLDFGEAHPAVVRAAADRQQAWAARTLEATPSLGAVVMGHTHHPRIAECVPGRWYVNPGAWLDGRCYATLDVSGPTLLTYR